MRNVLVRSCMALMVVGARFAAAQAPTSVISQISSAGSASVLVPGDRVTLRVAVAKRAGTAVEASRQMGPTVTRIQDTLRAIGSHAERLKIEHVIINTLTGKPNERPTYEARTTLALTTGNFDLVPQILDAFLAAGVSEIPSMSFQSDSLVTVRRRALAFAVRNAREEAEVIAAAMGGKLGRMIELSSVDGGGELLYRGPSLERKALPFAIQVPDRTVTVSAAVRARWEFVPGS